MQKGWCRRKIDADEKDFDAFGSGVYVWRSGRGAEHLHTQIQEEKGGA
jgi:hypothetical protein